MKNVKSLMLGALAALGVAATIKPAGAVTYTYNLAGTFSDSGTLSGSFQYDGSTFSNIMVTSSSISHTFTSIDFYGRYRATDTFEIDFSEGDYYMDIYFTDPLGSLPKALTDGSAEDGNIFVGLTSGSMTPAASIVTPIPAALPLAASALAGLGGLGWLQRRRVAAPMPATA